MTAPRGVPAGVASTPQPAQRTHTRTGGRAPSVRSLIVRVLARYPLTRPVCPCGCRGLGVVRVGARDYCEATGALLRGDACGTR